MLIAFFSLLQAVRKRIQTVCCLGQTVKLTVLLFTPTAFYVPSRARALFGMSRQWWLTVSG